ncbi:MAG: hypothetical protein L6Q81_16705 [Bacteroidia bacterium]|nr:hypothetical protein [Bacteroidia bacterium]
MVQRNAEKIICVISEEGVFNFLTQISQIQDRAYDLCNLRILWRTHYLPQMAQRYADDIHTLIICVISEESVFNFLTQISQIQDRAYDLCNLRILWRTHYLPQMVQGNTDDIHTLIICVISEEGVFNFLTQISQIPFVHGV